MVRVISEKLFSPPRSRHSSGEAVDKELAARAVEALSSLDSSSTTSSTRRSSVAVAEFFSDYESSSDSHWEWDSEVDIEGDGGGDNKNHARGGGAPSSSTEENANIGGECSGGEDVLQKRKERRRERNKLSAQAYRIRRREQCVKQQTVLRDLQDKNWRLKEQVHTLEEEIDHLRRTAVVGPPTPPHGRSKAPNPMSTITADMTSTALEGHSSLHPPGNGTVHEKRSCPAHRRLMDNDPTRRQLLSCPHVDNFSFSQPSPAPASSPAPSPGVGSSSSQFSFSPPPPPAPRAPPGAGHAVGQGHQLTRPPAVFSKASSVPPADSASSSSSVQEQVPPSQGRAHPHCQYPFQIAPPAADPQRTDVNANAEEGRDNLNNTIHTAGLGSRQRNDNVNNNMDNTTTTMLAVPPQGGARPKTKAVGPPVRPVHGGSEMFKFPKV